MKQKKFSLLINILLSLPKTIVFNLRYFPLRQAVRLPVLILNNFKVMEMHRMGIVFEGKCSLFQLRFSNGGSFGVPSYNRGEIWIEKNGIIKIAEHASVTFTEGTHLRIGGELIFNGNFNANKNCFIACSRNIQFGKEIMLGWNVVIRDSDGHWVSHDGIIKPDWKPILIGDHVWICSEAHILKGVTIGNDSILAYRSLATKAYLGDNLLIGGSPAKIIGRNVSWGHITKKG